MIIQIQLHPLLFPDLLSAVQPQWLAVNSLMFFVSQRVLIYYMFSSEMCYKFFEK